MLGGRLEALCRDSIGVHVAISSLMAIMVGVQTFNWRVKSFQRFEQRNGVPKIDKREDVKCGRLTKKMSS